MISPRLTGAGAIAVAVAALTTAAGCRERETGMDPGAMNAAIGSGQGPQRATRLLYPTTPSSFTDLVDTAKGSVVAIRSTTPVKSGPAAMFPGAPDATADVALGTGFLIEAGGVFVLTNDHIAAAAPTLEIMTVDNQVFPATLIGRDVRLDLALLKIEPAAPASGGAKIAPRLHALPMGDSDELAVGEWIVVLGNAFGDEVSASAGIVSATGRNSGSVVPSRAMGYRTYLQTDARIHRGNSGGPLLNTAGQVVGVALATGDRTTELSFAIPINRVREIVNSLRDFGQVSRGWLGVYVKPVDADLASQLGVAPDANGNRGGAVVTGVQSGSPAARSALRIGDVILKWGDKSVDSHSLPWVVAQTPIGTPITVTVWRTGALQELPVVTEKMPE